MTAAARGKKQCPVPAAPNCVVTTALHTPSGRRADYQDTCFRDTVRRLVTLPGRALRRVRQGLRYCLEAGGGVVCPVVDV